MIDLTTLNLAQKQAVEDTEGSVLVFAGAGSGKTRVLTYRIANIIDKKLAYPSEVLAITFTNKAANEMKERLQNLLGDVQNMWICTIHSMCTRILRRDIACLGYDTKFSIYSDVEKQRMISQIVKEKGMEERLVKASMNAIGYAKAAGMDADDYVKKYGFNPDTEHIATIFREYEKRLKFNNSLDFDDLLNKAYELLKTNEEIRNKYSERFKYIHIDEFQDVNDVQYKIVKLLSKNHKNLFAVGDDDQSIYSFRGANINNILNFQNELENVKIYKLEQNYRSTKKILDVANCIISKNIGRAEKNLWCDNQEGARVEYRSVWNETEEAYYVAQAIDGLKLHLGYKNSDIAILYRLNALSRTFETELLKYGIDYRIYGGLKFFDRKEVKDLTAYLRFICNPKDGDALKRIINVPKRGIGDVTVDKLFKISYDNTKYAYEVLKDIENEDAFNSGTKQKLIGFRDLFYELVSVRDTLDPVSFIKHVINQTNYMSQFDKSEEGMSRVENVNGLISSVSEFVEANPGSTIADYVQSITLVSSIDEYSDENDAVTLATVHAVKGLEFKVVFIVGLDDGVFPIVRYDTTAQDLEEERRLMYVAVTRAMERLYLTHCEFRYTVYDGQKSAKSRSRYIDDIKMLIGIKESESKSYEENIKDQDVFKGSKFTVEKPVVKNVANNQYEIGEVIKHKKFGEGTIIKVTGEDGRTTLDVAFVGLGIKTLVAELAPIEKV